MALSLIFKHDSDDIPRLYMADLLGAGLGVVVGDRWHERAGHAAGRGLDPAAGAAAAAVLAGRRAWRLLPLAVLAGRCCSRARAGPAARGAARGARAGDLQALGRDGQDQDLRLRGPGAGINIDNVANSPVLPFDGDWDGPGRATRPTRAGTSTSATWWTASSAAASSRSAPAAAPTCCRRWRRARPRCTRSRSSRTSTG